MPPTKAATQKNVAAKMMIVSMTLVPRNAARG